MEKITRVAAGTEAEPHWDTGAVAETGEVADAFIERYRELYHVFCQGQPMPTVTGIDRALLRKRLEQHSAETLEKWLPIFFGSALGYVRRRAYSLESYLNTLHVLQQAASARRRSSQSRSVHSKDAGTQG
jgi:hypothetical protein